MEDLAQNTNLATDIQPDNITSFLSQGIPLETQQQEPPIPSPVSEPSLSLYDKIELNIKSKIREYINEDDLVEEILNRPNITGKEWVSREEIANIMHLNINEDDYEYLNNDILDLYNNGPQDYHLNTTDKLMLECLGDYYGGMTNVYKKKLECYIKSIRAAKRPDDNEYIDANYKQLSDIIESDYKNWELGFKINLFLGNWKSWKHYKYCLNGNEKIKPLFYLVILLNHIIYNGIDTKLSLKKLMPGHKIDESDIKLFNDMAIEMGFPKYLIECNSLQQILDGKLKLGLDKIQDCPVCMETDARCVPINWVCGHYICVNCHNNIIEQKKCPICRFEIN